MRITALFLLLCFTAAAQKEKEVPLPSTIGKVTLFFTGAQVQHRGSAELRPGRQILVFGKLTDHLDPNSVQVKANGNLTILSVSTRKNFEDLKMTHSEIADLNEKKKKLQYKDRDLRDEYSVLESDKNLLFRNSDLKGEETGLKVSELKEAYGFVHARLTEIVNRQAALKSQLEVLAKEINKIEQEIDTRQTRPVTNYTEILVEAEVETATEASFFFNYISPKASWKPYYDLRSDGVGKPVKLEAKALVSQTTGIEWKNIDLVLSTNDPYENSKEPELKEWYLNYNNYPPQKYSNERSVPVFDYSGQRLRGEVIDASTGEPLPFAKIGFPNNPSVGVSADFDGKFEVIVPRGATHATVSYIGYKSRQMKIDAPYLKFVIEPEQVMLEEVVITGGTPASYSIDDDESRNALFGKSGSRQKAKRAEKEANTYQWGEMADSLGARNVAVQVTQKDLRVEYAIQTRLTIPSDGQDQRVSISDFMLPASYEYHSVPKLDPSAYLVAKVSGWEKLNLLNGESNLYFDGTYIGKTYVDANSTKDTLSFSLGKDNKVQVERTKITEKSKSRTIGSRQKTELAWQIRVKNNGGAMIRVLVKDQFPISTNEDIKVKRGDYPEGKVSENSGIITWIFDLPQGQNKTLSFEYTVEAQKGYVLYVE